MSSRQRGSRHRCSKSSNNQPGPSRPTTVSQSSSDRQPIRRSSLIPESFDWIKATAAPSRYISGGTRDKGQHAGSKGQSCGVVRREAEELTLDEFGERQRRRKSKTDADGNEQQNLPHHHPNDLALRSAESHAYADFARALRDGIGHHAVEADDCEKRCQKAKDRGETRYHALCGERLRDLRVFCTHVDNRQ